MSAETLTTFLSSCPGITTLYLRGSSVGPHLLPVLAEMQIKRLGIALMDLFPEGGFDGGHALFRSVTHLEILLPDYMDLSGWDIPIGRMPSLTHLTFTIAPGPAVIRPLLKRCPSLRVLRLFPVLQPPGPENTRAFTRRYISDAQLESPDARIVMYGVPHRYDRSQWVLAARGEDDVWIPAGQFIERKRRGEVGDSLSVGESVLERTFLELSFLPLYLVLRFLDEKSDGTSWSRQSNDTGEVLESRRYTEGADA
ncbi:hypothetical protein FB45DRAFT_1124370 [Roridomyces roridus]|uniref:Uncharacterized protein n=1 Tax=Roridomyces roridus TaxID=1738132 RepID=A0AAD7C6V2_9AGAR|nr:hypothetical protein FB45DRAFT_1124370 [Roridomyces roridus]